MEGAFIIRELESCYVCNEYMGTFKNELTVVTGYSEKPIYQLWGENKLKFFIVDSFY